MDKNILRITFKNHVVAMYSAIVMLLFFLVVLIYLNFHPDFIFIFAIFFLVFDVPGIYLHVEYWFQNKGEIYEVYPDIVIRYNEGKEERYNVENIECIKVYGSATLFKTWFHLSAMEQYHFARVYLKNGDKLIITCLLAPRVDKALSGLKGVKIEKKKWLFNSIYIPESWY